jgi:L-amino acid N-acyltransferase
VKIEEQKKAKTMVLDIGDAEIGDMGDVLELHNHAVRNLDALWTEHEQSLAERKDWFEKQTAAGFPVLVARGKDGRLAGYGSYGPFRARSGYDLSVEHSVYLWPQAQGQGTGKALLIELIARARRAGMHTMIAGIDGQNSVSMGLHKAMGFVEQGLLKEVGFKNGRWLDLRLLVLRLDERPPPAP